MTRRSCDGAGLLAAFRAAVANLEAHVDEINALNVFPVPDGDTGSNMLATVRAALEEAERRRPEPTPTGSPAAISFGALMGARGNSGVITSQILSGMAERPGRQAPVQRPRPRPRADARDRDRLRGRRRSRSRARSSPSSARRAAAAVAAAERDNDIETRPRGDASRRPSGPSPGRPRCCRSCARPASSTRAARASTGCSRARSRPLVGEAGRRRVGAPAARAPRPADARRPRRRGLRLRDDVPPPARHGRPLDLDADPDAPRDDRRVGPRGRRRARGQGPRPQRAAGRGHRLRPVARARSAGSASRTSTTRRTTSARRRAAGVHRRRRAGAGATAIGAGRRRRLGVRARVADGDPRRAARDAPARGCRWPSSPSAAGDGLAAVLSRRSGSARRSSAAARRRTRAPASCSRRSRRSTPTRS